MPHDKHIPLFHQADEKGLNADHARAEIALMAGEAQGLLECVVRPARR